MEDSRVEECICTIRKTSIWYVHSLERAQQELLTRKKKKEYAAAFFLLAGNLQDAVNVCAHQLHDLQLAIAIARVYDGDNSSVLRSLLEDKVLPQAAFEGNRWLATWAFWLLGRRDMAVRVLIVRSKTGSRSRHTDFYFSLLYTPC